MNTSPLRIVIVDDEHRYRERLRKKLSDHTMKCTALPPPPTPLPDDIVSARPDAVLVDYQLTQRQQGSSDPPAAYLGSLLVAAIRQRLPKTPLILLTRRKLASADTDFLDGAADLDEAFDDLLFKEDVDDRPAALRAELRSLVEGYHTLGQHHGSWNEVLAALGTPEYAKDELRRLGSPIGTLPHESFRPASVSRWIRRVVLRFPGPLVDDVHAATDIGITMRSFRKASVAKWFEPTRYTGVFASEYPRWWRGALRARAESLQAAMKIDEASGDALNFARIWNKKHPKNRVVAAKCCVCALPTRDAVCKVRKQPVMLRCSVPYYPDNRPAAFDVARISFRAIRETELMDEMFASDVLPIVREIEDDSEDR